jgi:hypothetical protein
MKKTILTPIVLGILTSAVMTGCGGSSTSDSGAKKVCDYNIQGGTTVDILFGTAYTNPSVKVLNEGKEVTFKLDGVVDSNKVGQYKVTYTGESCENSEVRTVNVVPSSCAYKLTGDNPLQISLGDTFVEPGFEVKDINNKIVKGTAKGAVDASTVGEYSLTYQGEGCKNSQTRVVKVVGGSCSYTLLGDSPLMLNLGDTYNDPGVTVKDAKQNTVTSAASGAVDTSIIGDYTITYQGDGCANTQTRTVTVKATTSVCAYELNGSNPLEVVVGDTYQELGVNIKDADNQSVTGTVSGAVDTATVGDYVVTYQSASCTNTATRTVKVVSADCSYTLKGDNPLLVNKDDTFTDPGVTAKDSTDTEVISVVSGEVDTTTLGDYILTYKGKDCANSQVRTVKVGLQTCVYTLLGASPLEIILNNLYTDSGAEIKDSKGVVLEAKAMGTGVVDNTKVGEYVVTYQSEVCGNSTDRIVKVRALTDDELKDIILPKI